MIYWLIPYLVAYNASDAGNWRYGPEHVFKVEVRSTARLHSLFELHSNVDMYLVCRPMNSSLIGCRSELATIENWNIEADRASSSESHAPEPFEVANVAFQVEFDEDGVSKLWLMKTQGRYRLDMFRAIFDTVHWGIDMSGKKYGRYVRSEKSMIGSCETTFDIGRKASSQDEMDAEKAVDGYSFDVPAFEGRTRNEPIVIEKNRNVDRCSKKSVYFFGNSGDDESENKHGIMKKTEITSSRSRIYLGRNSFSGYTRNIGTLEFSSSRTKEMRSFANIDESLHLSLETIRPAKDDTWQTGDSANSGAGTPLPKEDAPVVTFFM